MPHNRGAHHGSQTKQHTTANQNTEADAQARPDGFPRSLTNAGLSSDGPASSAVRGMKDYFEVTHDPTGWVNEDGSRAPLWSSGEVRPAQSLGQLMAHALEQGYSTSTRFELPDADAPEVLGKIYQREFGRYPKLHVAFQRQQAAAHHLANNGDPYGLQLPAAATSGARPDYGTTKKI